MRTIAWFSSGAASAVAVKLSQPNVIAYCDTGSEDYDNKRFMDDCRVWFNQEIIILKSDKFKDTWDVWEKKKYISGIAGAPCTGELKFNPREKFQCPDDLHIFGYTADKADVTRAETLQENWPELNLHFPLIDNGLTKAACIELVERAGIKPPRVYAMGFPNANCIPCSKATSPAYWALIRKEFPKEFERFAKLCHEIGVRAARLNGERIFVDEIPLDHPTTQPIAPECDFLCHMADQEFKSEAAE